MHMNYYFALWKLRPGRYPKLYSCIMQLIIKNSTFARALVQNNTTTGQAEERKLPFLRTVCAVLLALIFLVLCYLVWKGLNIFVQQILTQQTKNIFGTQNIKPKSITKYRETRPAKSRERLTNNYRNMKTNYLTSFK